MYILDNQEFINHTELAIYLAFGCKDVNPYKMIDTNNKDNANYYSIMMALNEQLEEGYDG